MSATCDVIVCPISKIVRFSDFCGKITIVTFNEIESILTLTGGVALNVPIRLERSAILKVS